MCVADLSVSGRLPNTSAAETDLNIDVREVNFANVNV